MAEKVLLVLKCYRNDQGLIATIQNVGESDPITLDDAWTVYDPDEAQVMALYAKAVDIYGRVIQRDRSVLVCFPSIQFPDE